MSKEANSQLAIRQEKFIRDLKNALIRIENKSYGICRVTGKLINPERLKLVNSLKRYTQINQGQASLTAGFSACPGDALGQIAWQHHCGYYCAMQMADVMLPVPARCEATPPPVAAKNQGTCADTSRLCPVCPVESSL